MAALLIQIQVIYALILREVCTRFGTHRLGYLWAFVNPLLWIGTFAVLFQVMGRPIPMHLETLPFLAASFVPFLLFREMASRVSGAIGANRGLLYYVQVRPLDLVLARGLLEFLTFTVIFMVLIGGWALYRWELEIPDLLTVILGLALAGALGFSLGLVFCGLSVLIKAVERLQSPLIRPLFWISAIFYSPVVVPPELRRYLMLNPIVHVLELVRHGLFRGYPDSHASVLYPLAWILALLAAGLGLERIARKRTRLSV